MAKYNIQKAVEFDKTSTKFRAKYANVDALVEAGWVAQPKHDGCFGQIIIEPGNARILTRTGELVRSADHVLSAVLAACSRKGVTHAKLFGELWYAGAKFPEISGDVRRHTPAPRLRFIAFDMIPHEGDESQLSYKVRREFMASTLGYLPTPEYEIVKQHLVASATEYAKQLKAHKTEAYDGCVLRDYTSTYTIGDTKLGQIVKVKPDMSLDLEVTASYAEQRATKLGGYLTVRHVNPVSGEFTTSDVGSGLTQQMCQEIMTYVDRYVGRIAEIEFMGYTEDGYLREPRFKGWRTDKLQPDV